ncbi:MAG: hypothetical protein GX063_05345 [Firmicutes bacterium]|nr:hypothetical protein [Bacillota bacterium]
MYLVISLRRPVLLLAVAAMIIGCVSTAGYAFVTSYLSGDTIVSGVKVASVNVGGLTIQEAAAYLSGHLDEIVQRPITIVHDSMEWRLFPHDIGITPDLESILLAAFQVGRQGNILRKLAEHYQSQLEGWDIPLIVSVDEARLTNALRKIAVTANIPPLDARITITEDDVIEIVPGVPGQKVDIAELIEEVIAASTRPNDRKVVLRPKLVIPDFSTEDALALRVRRCIAEYTTTFDATDLNRVNNIRLAASCLDGVLLKPGEMFSFNRQVGPRLDSDGYKPAPVIIGGELLPGIGGGVCQVSTTLYNTVLLAGLDVVARSPHSLPITYVPLGRDAAVAYDYMDLTFRNNSPYGVLLRARVDEDRLTIRIFSDAPPERSIELDSQIVRVLHPKVITKIDPALGPGVTIEERRGRQGYEVLLWRTIKMGDQMIEKELVERTIYWPQDRVIRQGPPVVEGEDA